MKRLSQDIEALHPSLRHLGYKVTSPPDQKYNCVAFAAKDTSQWWEPVIEHGVFWPKQLPLEDSLENYINAFKTKDYIFCETASLECRFEKIAIYRDSFGSFMHVARQLSDGNWTSKLGVHEDIEHKELAALEDDDYGYVGIIMKKRCEFLGILARAFFKFRIFLWTWRRAVEHFAQRILKFRTA